MARETWTDERLDDLKEGMNQRFDQVETEMNHRFDRVEADIRELRAIMIGGFVTLLVALIGTNVL